MSRRRAPTAAAAASAGAAGAGGRLSSRRRAPASASAAALPPPDAEAEGEDSAAYTDLGGKRSYNSAGYWDQRYALHFAQAAEAGKDGGGKGERPSKRARTSGGAVASPSATAPAGDDVTSSDITSEWYYSYSDLAPMLARALRGVDRAGSVLDIGCGVSSFFLDLQREGLGDSSSTGVGAGAGSGAAAAATPTPEAPPSRGLSFTGPCIGVDYSPSVVAHLQRVFPPAKHPQLHWICADACYLLEEPPRQKGKGTGGAQGKRRGKGKGKGEESESDSAGADADAGASSFVPPALSAADRARFFTPGSFSLILDKATSDGMLCSDATARLTPLLYANVARLLAPGGVFLCASVNEPESGWFGEYVVSSLLEHGGEGTQWHIEVHSPGEYKDGEQGAPNVYIIRKSAAPQGRARAATREQREPYTIKRICY